MSRTVDANERVRRKLALGRIRRLYRVARTLEQEYGRKPTPDEIAARLEALKAAGVNYVLLSGAGSRDNLRRFACEIMPAFASA